MTTLYHAHLPGDFGDFKKGYIGITDDMVSREIRHRQGISGCPILKKALLKYPDIVFSEISQGSREEMLRMEAWLRPKAMGWNAVAGGGAPPSHLGKSMSQEQKNKIGKANSGTNGPGWKGWWEIDGIRYDSAKIAATALGCSKYKVQHRAKSPKYPTWNFVPK